MRRHLMLVALLGTAALAGCGGSDDKTTGKSATPTDTIKIAQFLYSPDPVTVKVGAKIAVVNADSAPHTVTEKGPSPSFDSGTVKGKASGSVTFEEPGTFTYYCQFHATMKGTVTVVQ